MSSTATTYISPTRKKVAGSKTVVSQGGSTSKQTIYEAATSVFKPFYGWLNTTPKQSSTAKTRVDSGRTAVKMFKQPLVKGVKTSSQKSNESSSNKEFGLFFLSS